jgi:hypothetical protein
MWRKPQSAINGFSNVAKVAISMSSANGNGVWRNVASMAIQSRLAIIMKAAWHQYQWHQ